MQKVKGAIEHGGGTLQVFFQWFAGRGGAYTWRQYRGCHTTGNINYKRSCRTRKGGNRRK